VIIATPEVLGELRWRVVGGRVRRRRPTSGRPTPG
jgi:hypothetical protein